MWRSANYFCVGVNSCKKFHVYTSKFYSLFTFPVESHLASNVHKSRLVQQDLRVAKRLQEEEDKRAKAESKKKHQHLWEPL